MTNKILYNSLILEGSSYVLVQKFEGSLNFFGSALVEYFTVKRDTFQNIQKFCIKMPEKLKSSGDIRISVAQQLAILEQFVDISFWETETLSGKLNSWKSSGVSVAH